MVNKFLHDLASVSFSSSISQHGSSSLYTAVVLNHLQSPNSQHSFSSPHFCRCSHPLCLEHSSPAPLYQVNTHSFQAQLRCHVFKESSLTSQGYSVPLFCSSLTAGTDPLGTICHSVSQLLACWHPSPFINAKRLGCRPGYS